MSRNHQRAGRAAPPISRAGRGGSAPDTISARWLAAAVSAVFVGAVLCVWGALCFLFWQGSWQLLDHPKAAIAATPSSAGLAFESIDFATTEAGQPQLHGWWIPGPSGTRFTAIYLHGADGNIGDAVPALAPLHAAKLNLLVFDYRGYGRSQFVRPSEAHWREDTEWAIRYLTATRHVEAASIVLAGSGLGANLAAEVAAVHPELAGVLLEDPALSPEEKVFDDPRARMVPAHWLVRDRWDLADSAARLRLPSLWLEGSPPQTPAYATERAAYDRVSARKVRVWLSAGPRRTTDYTVAVARWLDDLAPSTQTH
jgi:pimeloyl-ACP methyl ester carboxylesterase